MGNKGQLELYLGNKTAQPLTRIDHRLDGTPGDQEMRIVLADAWSGTAQPKTQARALLQCEVMGAFSACGYFILDLCANGGQPMHYRIALPIFLTNVMTGITLVRDTFIAKWQQLSQPGLELQKVFSANKAMDRATTQSVMEGLGLTVLPNVMPNPANYAGAGVVSAHSPASVGVLVHLEPNEQAKMYRVTVRTSNQAYSRILMDLMCDAL